MPDNKAHPNAHRLGSLIVAILKVGKWHEKYQSNTPQTQDPLSFWKIPPWAFQNRE